VKPVERLNNIYQNMTWGGVIWYCYSVLNYCSPPSGIGDFGYPV